MALLARQSWNWQVAQAQAGRQYRLVRAARSCRICQFMCRACMSLWDRQDWGPMSLAFLCASSFQEARESVEYPSVQKLQEQREG